MKRHITWWKAFSRSWQQTTGGTDHAEKEIYNFLVEMTMQRHVRCNMMGKPRKDILGSMK